VTSDDTVQPDAYGVHVNWIDALDTEQQVSADTVDALHAVIGEPPSPPGRRAVRR